MLGELPKNLQLMCTGDPEEQQNITSAYKMTGEAKVKGIIEFLENLFSSVND